MMNVPLVDLKSLHSPLKEEFVASFENILGNSDFILGEAVSKFEKSFSENCGTIYSVGVGSGTEAIHLALRAAGIGQGDEVIVPAHTFIASAIGVISAGARPVLVDVNEETFHLDMNQVESALNLKTKAILPVHLYGRMMNLDDLNILTEKKGLIIIEDAAQAHGAEISGKRAGSVGHLGCFSFYPGKNLGALGDGGMVVTNEVKFKSKLASLRNLGSTEKYKHPILGFNSRLDTLQAAFLNTKLPHLDEWNSKRRENAGLYNRYLEGVGDLTLPSGVSDPGHVVHLYVIRTKRRDELLSHLNENGIGAGIHYPVPVHLHGAMEYLSYKIGDFPVSEKICNEILSLPMFPGLSSSQIEVVVETVKGFFEK